MQKSSWAAPTFEEVDMESGSARDDVDDSSQLLGRDTPVRLRSHDRQWGAASVHTREDA